jgi:uncharacterized HhH-GPD family protein
MNPTSCLAQQPEAGELLGRTPLAVLGGVQLNQQVPMEWAFSGPYTIAQRLGQDELDAAEIAAYNPEAFTEPLKQKPAVHRSPGNVAKRVRLLCQYLVEECAGSASAIGRDAASGDELLARLKALPGFGEQKAKIFPALLGERFDIRPQGRRVRR